MRKNFSKPVAIVSALFVTTSCSLFAQKTFDWFVATKNNIRINYVLLIGQNEHTDSIERTRWTRETFHTRDESTEINGNANLGVPKKGWIALEGGQPIPGKILDVYEIEHSEQKSLAGIAWDPITANNSMNTWLCKHDTDISIVISNNDCMAEGAMMASNWIKNLPVIGYDANASAIERIADPNNDSLQGTIDQNAASQTATMGLLVRNILDDLNNKDTSSNHKIGTTEYNPVYTWSDETHTSGTNDRGFGGKNSVVAEEEKGYYINGFDKALTSYSDEPKLDGLICPVDNPNNLYLGYSRIEGETDPSSGAHEILSNSFAIDKENVKDYISEDGSAKLPADLAWGRFVETTKKPTVPSYRICMTVNSSSDVFLNTTLLRYMQTYAPQLNLNLDTPIMGNGSDEEKMLKEIASRGSKYDAYLINMSTTGDGMSFITTIAPQAAAHEGKGKVPKDGWDNFKDRLDTPLIFYNKQPMTSEGNIDYNVMNNRYFKYTYYVGSSAEQGGQAQGDLIKKCLNTLYVKAEKEKMR